MISYRSDTEGVTPDQLSGFFEGWPRAPSPARRLDVLRSADHVVLALDGYHLIGFVTAISDRSFCAAIALLEVLPGYRRRGVGSELVRRVLSEIGDVYMVDVSCDEDVRPFYERLGFTAATAMIIRNRDSIDRAL